MVIDRSFFTAHGQRERHETLTARALHGRVSPTPPVGRLSATSERERATTVLPSLTSQYHPE